ncbi:MAG: J domain-containing protein [Eubacteriales bacterium]|nr:J domain-containing protein [Eubacteriales bacterium]
MANAFDILGIKPTYDKTKIRAAYHKQVKHCHPDRFENPTEQDRAQKKLIALNLAYEEAMKYTASPSAGYHSVPAVQAKRFAEALLEKNEPESALRQLVRADSKDDDWYYIEGSIMMKLHQYEAAHSSFREAVRQQPDNLKYRRAALQAAVELKKRKNPLYRIMDGVYELFRRVKTRSNKSR